MTNNGLQIRKARIPAMGEVLNERWSRLLFISLTLNILLVEVLFLLLPASSKTVLAGIPGYYLIPMVLLSIFGALAPAYLITWVFGARPFPFSVMSGLLLGLAVALNVISTGCPTCSSPLLEQLGITDGLAAYPLGGLELKLISVLVAVYLLWSQRTKDREDPPYPSPPDPDQPPGEVIAPRRKRKPVGHVLWGVSIIVAFFSMPLVPTEMKLFTRNEPVTATRPGNPEGAAVDFARIIEQISPDGGYALPVSYGEIGPQLLETGAIDLELMEQLYAASEPLTNLQREILKQGSDEQIVIDRENARFLLHFFWALGLTNQNAILDEGPMQIHSEGDIGRFASTGGWTLGQKSATELYSSAPLVSLTKDQQDLVERVAQQIYRPCCNNPTIFPDCNHGMAMLGMLQLLASADADEEALLKAAKYVNAFWFPQQTFEVGLFANLTQGLEFEALDPALAVGPELFSASGFNKVHSLLGAAGLLDQGAGSGSSCGV